MKTYVKNGAKNNAPIVRPKAKGIKPGEKNIKSSKVFVRKYYYLAGIIIISAFLFSKITSNDFTTWDDDEYITNSEIIQDLSAEGIKDIFTAYHVSNYHPFTILLYALQYRVFELSATGYHYVSLFLHIMNIILVFFLFIYLGFKEKIIIPIVLLFAIHPMHVESVAWASEQKDLLYSLFYIAAIISYLLWIKTNKKHKWYFISLVLFLFSLLSKSMAVTLPVLLLLIDWFLGRNKIKASLVEKLPFFALSILFGVMAIISQSEANALDIVPDVTVIDRIFLVSYAIVFYLFKLFVPVKLSVMHYYPAKVGGFLPLYYYLMPLVIIALIYLIYKIKTGKRIFIFGTLFFLITISVVLQIIPVGGSVVSERYTYIPYLGLFLIVSYYYYSLLESKNRLARKTKSWIYAIGIAYLCFLAVTTYDRIYVWEDGITLFTDVKQKNPDNYHPYVVLGNAYFSKRNFPDAIKNFDKAIELNNEKIELYMNRGFSKIQAGGLKEALDDYNHILRIKPDHVSANTNRGIIHMRLGDKEKALEDFNRALTLNPKDVVSLIQRSQLYFDMNNINEAFRDLDKAISIKPRSAAAYSKRGFFYAQTGNYEEALKDLAKAVKINPGNSDIYLNLANTKLLMGNPEGALKDLNKVIEINPNNGSAYGNRGVVKMRLGMRKEACKDFNKALNLGYPKAIEYLKQYCQ